MLCLFLIKYQMQSVFVLAVLLEIYNYYCSFLQLLSLQIV